MKNHYSILFAAALLAGCTATKPCDPARLNCDSGTRATGGAISRPSMSNNPGGLSGGGQVGTGTSPGTTTGTSPSKPGPSKPSNPGPSKPGKGDGGKPGGHGHGGKGKGK